MNNTRLIKVKSYNDFRKDPYSGAIIDINSDKIEADRKKLKKQKQQYEEINQLKSDVSDIKYMLQQLLEKN
tara:strand:- start:659 stop:871 length:213 start_codon:yes stop_codon:yes gene_type:complete